MPDEPHHVPVLEVTQDDLEKAKSQITLYRDMLDAEFNEDEPSQNFISRMEVAIDQIEAEAREYYYALNKVPRPELCGLCNWNPINKNVVTKFCPYCTGDLKNNRPSPTGSFNWVCKKNDKTVFCINTPDAEEPDIPGEDVI